MRSSGSPAAKLAIYRSAWTRASAACRDHRLAAGLTQQERADLAGLGVRAVSDIESPGESTAARCSRTVISSPSSIARPPSPLIEITCRPGAPTLPDIYCFVSVDIPRWGQSGSTQYVSAYGEVRCTETVDEISLSVFAIREDNAAWEADAFVIQWPSANTVAVAPCATMRWVAEADALVIPPPGYHPDYRFSSDISPVVDISCRVTLPPPPPCPGPACAREGVVTFSQPAVASERAKAVFRTKG